MKQLKALKKSDHVSITFGEWFDKVNGNTYYDAVVYIDDKVYEIPYQYGYNHGDKQAIDEALAECGIGYRVRVNSSNPHLPYSYLHISCIDKLKRNLIKEYSEG